MSMRWAADAEAAALNPSAARTDTMLSKMTIGFLNVSNSISPDS